VFEDKILVWQLRRGSREALCRIYEKYRDDMLRLAAGLVGERSEAEDAVHEVFASFVEFSRSFVLTGSLKGYLCTCVANKARNLNRTRQRRHATGLEDAKPLASDIKRPDQWIIETEKFQRLHGAISQLPFEQREVVLLRLQGGMTFKEIAQVQQIPLKTALSRYGYGIDKLRSNLNGEVTK
jgi:RNA polymerase sigma-70 factor (ECF subfamily)